MPLPRFALLFIALLVVGEAGVQLWRHLPAPVSTDSVFSFPPAAANFDKPGKLAPAIELYGADRGAEWNLSTAGDTRLTVFYFEWDEVEVGPLMSMAGHSPDECNVAAGFTLHAILPPRSHEVPGQQPLAFDATHFTDPSGRSVHMFKMPWIQGLGARKLREGAVRSQRLHNSFIHHAGAARVLQAGVFDAKDADHAWQTFQHQVLDHLEWR
jgi:hypothetical protein